MKNTPKLLLAVAAVVALRATVAQASIEMETVTVAPSLSGLGGLTFSLPAFNPALGTLNSVELTLTPQLGAVGDSALNLTSSPQTANGEVEWIQNGRFRMGSSSSGFSSKDSLKILLPSSPL